MLPLESEPEPTILAHPFTPFAEPAPAADVPAAVEEPSDSPSPVMAEPEFLPPREFVPIRDREQENGSTTHGVRREPYDEVQILPSRRGQYKTRG